MTVSSVLESTRALVPRVVPHVSVPSRPVLSRGAAQALGVFSIALGLAELIAPRRLAQSLGLDGKETIVRAYGGREIAAGVTALAGFAAPAMWARVVGDVLDLATLAGGRRNRETARNISLAIAAVAGIAALDLCVAGLLSAPAAGQARKSNWDFLTRWF